MNNNISYIVQIVIAIIAYIAGYPKLGSTFIVTMAPLCMYMVIKKDPGYIPALMVHCASLTSISFLTLLSVVIVCLFHTKTIMSDKRVAVMYVILIVSLPLYFLLVYQRMTYDGDTWQAAFQYCVYYLAFWCFPYGMLLAEKYNGLVTKLIIFTLFACFFLVKIKLADVSRLFSLSVYIIFVFGIIEYMNMKLIKGTALIVLYFLMFYSENMTFTELLTAVYAVSLFILYLKHKNKPLKLSTGITPFVIILLLMAYAIVTYDNSIVGDHSDKMDFSSWNGFWSRAKYKLYDDRAIFWKAGFEQIIEYNSLLPMHDIPNFDAVEKSGWVMADVSFGAHNTPLQLIRIFGILMGVSLVYCYVESSILACKCLFHTEQLFDGSTLLFVVIYSNSIILFLTGTAAMLPACSFLYFTSFGLSYQKTALRTN